MRACLKIPLAAALLLCEVSGALADSTIALDHSLSWAGNIGWINWRADGTNGIDVTSSYCAGYLYSANVGWINLGNKPVHGVSYSNSADDYGVNIDSTGNLRGNAYGANIGWVVFEAKGSPKVDIATGKLSGYAYSANAGWLSLADQTNFIQSVTPPNIVDLDHDGIADAWEIQYAGTLDRFNATSDSDGDGVSDLDEFRSGTSPLDPLDYLKILNISTGASPNLVTISWTSSPTRQYLLESRENLISSSWKQFNTVPGDANSNQTSTTFEVTSNPQFFRVRTGN